MLREEEPITPFVITVDEIGQAGPIPVAAISPVDLSLTFVDK
jgi:hypothetical protein